MSPDDDSLSWLAPLDPMAPMREVERLADGVAATLQVARGLLQACRQVDLAGLDRMVGLLCARLLDLPHEQGLALRPRLIALQGELDWLEAAMRRPANHVADG